MNEMAPPRSEKKLVILRNTFPRRDTSYHGEIGEEVFWEMTAKGFKLVSKSTGRAVFMTAPVRKDGLLVSNGKQPALYGLVGKNKAQGWYLEIGYVDEKESKVAETANHGIDILEQLANGGLQ